MKRSLLLMSTLIIAAVVCTAFSKNYQPVFMKRVDLENSVFYQNAPRELKAPGKIYVSGNLLFVNERYKGIHIIDNTNPSSPQKLGFIVAPGCLDVAVKGNMLYLDNAVDLVTFSLDEKKEVSRIKNYFPEPSCPGYGIYNYERPDGFILVEWENAN